MINLKLRVVRGDQTQDVYVTAAPSAKIGDVVQRLARTKSGWVGALGSCRGRSIEQRVLEPRVISADVAIAESGLRSGDVVTLRPDGAVEVDGARQSLATTDGNIVLFNRSPRLDPKFAGIELVAPEPPQPRSSSRFPVVTVLVPVVIAGVVFAVTRSLMSILFVALSPIMMLGIWLENRLADAKQYKGEVAKFRSGVADLEVQLVYAQRLESVARCGEHPSAQDVLSAVNSLAPLMWARRPEHSSFLQVRLGLGTQDSRNTVLMPTAPKDLELWNELVLVVRKYSQVAAVPVVADVKSCGNIGVAGPLSEAASVVRGLVAQFVGLHSPAELTVGGVAGAQNEYWEWMKWLPHCDSKTALALKADNLLAFEPGEVNKLVAAVSARITDRLAGERDRCVGLPILLFLVHDDVQVDRAQLVQIAERGPSAGVYVVWHSNSVAGLPAACRTFIDVAPRASCSVVGFVETGQRVADVVVESVGMRAIEELAVRLSPVVDSGVLSEPSVELCATVSLLDLLCRDISESPETVIEMWRSADSLLRRGIANLRALIGQSSGGPLTIDLRADGPHALVGGTTGAGKSEFLQSWILSMAAGSSPERLTFLLIDYKGGAAFADCVNLPHCVGLVTDLSPHLVRRALVSLNAEVRYREQLMHANGAKDLASLERRAGFVAPPSLVIVIDEFAALVADVPEFIDGVVSIAQRGRSLGLHLVLATQRPGGVINDNLRANTNLRIALRMADEIDSIDVIGSSLASRFDPCSPGRAAVRAGTGPVTVFQTAYAGDFTVAQQQAGLVIRQLCFGVGTTLELPVETALDRYHGTGQGNDLQRIVRTMNAAAVDMGLVPPRRPWLPMLADVYVLEALPTGRTDSELVVGVVDEPASQTQRVLAYRPDVDGNMSVFGSGGSGKSTLLRSIAYASGIGCARGGPCWIYALDFGSRALSGLELLPHVGAVIAGEDHQRVVRLLRKLAETVASRLEIYSSANASTIDEYRQLTGSLHEPRIILLVDAVGTFRADYEVGSRQRWWDVFQSIAAEGRAVGVHVVVTADRPAAVPSSLAATIQRRVVLRLANEFDCAMLDIPADVRTPTGIPGRGLVDGLEVQIAVLGGNANATHQAGEVRLLASAIARTGFAPADAIGRLPCRVTLSELPKGVDGRPTLGLRDEDLAPIGFDPTGVFLIVGPPRSGRSTTLATMVTSIRALRPDVDFALFCSCQSGLAGFVGPTVFSAVGITDISIGAAQLVERLARLEARATSNTLIVVIEGIGELVNTDADPPLNALLQACRERDVFVVAEGETSSLAGSWPLLQAVKANRTGIVLQPDQMDGDMVFRTAFERIESSDFALGGGLLVGHDGVTKVLVAVTE